jgi:predicted transglutaminase-like cysteine proteinase
MLRVASLVFVLALALAGPSAEAASTMATGPWVAPPVGFLGFCLQHLTDCVGSAREPVAVELTVARRQELDAVQAEVNRAIKPRLDPSHVWRYPTDGYGDCNDYAVAKRERLIALGWPREALLLTAAITERGEGHLVLVARTSAGDLVLDNRVPAVVEWSRLPYRWVSQQSQRNLAQWVSVVSQTAAGAARGGHAS